MRRIVFFSAAPGMKGLAGDKGNLPFDGHLEHFGGIHILRQDAPQEHASVRLAPGHLRREHLLHHLDHHIPAFLVGGAYGLDMLVQEAALCHFIGNILIECGCMQIRSLLGHDQLADHLRRGNDPRQPSPGASSFEKVLR